MRPVRVLHADAPAERLAALRIAVGAFALVYLVLRIPVFLRLRQRDGADFDAVGPLGWLSAPLPGAVVVGLLVVAVGAGVAFTAGWYFRLAGPVFAVLALVLTTYRSSWGQLLHFENLLALHLLVVGLAAAADAWSIDAHRRRTRQRSRRAASDYGLALWLACLVVVVAYVIAGVAKLRYGGSGWIAGDTLRNHVAYSAARLDLLGGAPSPLAAVAVRHAAIWTPMAVLAVLVELLAPVALLGGRWRNGWVVAAWALHAAIAALMLVVFPYPLFLVAFLPFFPLERLVPFARAAMPDRSVRAGTGPE